MNNEQQNEKWARTGRLYFSTRSYPTFGRGVFSATNPPATVTSSPYYWWFMFLRLNEDYKATCEAGGVGKCAELYKDFGDIYCCDFKEWWLKQGHSVLFAEKRSDYVMQIATKPNELAPFDSDMAINLVVPLNWTHQALKKRFTELVLKLVEKAPKGVHVEESSAKYKLSGKWHIEALANAYKVYTLRHENADGEEFSSTVPNSNSKRKVTRYQLAWADVAIRAQLKATEGLKEKSLKAKNSDARRVATILAMRHYKRALGFIQAAATSTFPQSK